MDSELEKSLQDVRAAYRLLYAYHKRVKGIITVIENELYNMGLKFWEWEPEYWYKPKRKLSPQNWTWDCFPFHTFTSWYAKNEGKGVPRSGDMLVSVMVQTDTALDKCFEDNSSDHDPSKFRPVEGNTSKSLITVQVIRCDSYLGKKNWNEEDNWDTFNFLNQENGFSRFHITRNFADLEDEDAAKNMIANLIEKINQNQSKSDAVNL